MYRKLPKSAGNTLAYALEVELSEEDVQNIQAELSAAIEQHGSLRLLVRADGLDDIEPWAVWQDLKMAPDYMRHIERLAVVGDRRWHDWVAKLSNSFADAAYFEPAEATRAWQWLGNPTATPAEAP
jgi:uncharacterized membrane protein